ncbi:DUF1015 domain-containing protein [Ruminococcus champanellensis]|uniref:DUF1015 domain-containing protein n=1 Tax=Ruminococcus champanellensis TaxID=1161942 RepID=UPI0023F0DE1C|nr:DUF1015 domain-containing protein [Ruminococcus champanellensis]
MQAAFSPADILLPGKDIDKTKWAVVACDQYTSEPDYWNAVAQQVGDSPSTLQLILPELYLEQPDVEHRIEKIQAAMQADLEAGCLDCYPDALIYVERIQSDGKCRQGLIGKLDLEQYDYAKGSTSPVRATEATVLERIPPRKKVRQGAPLELPHIMILIDDIRRTVIEPLAARKDSMQKLYDFDLMQGGGHLTGYLIPADMQQQVLDALDALADPAAFAEKYDLAPGTPVLQYAMGDGNHSLATAKACYEQLKAEHPGEDLSSHPARYALVELVNLHSDALQFEAIHRIVTGVDPADLMGQMQQALQLTEGTQADCQCFTWIQGGKQGVSAVHAPTSKLTVGSLQQFLDGYLAAHPGAKIDYIHGADVVQRLAAAPDAIGFLLPDMGKEELFPTVIGDGALPRKTFSMGHAADKRFYMECRRITE